MLATCCTSLLTLLRSAQQHNTLEYCLLLLCVLGVGVGGGLVQQLHTSLRACQWQSLRLPDVTGRPWYAGFVH